MVWCIHHEMESRIDVVGSAVGACQGWLSCMLQALLFQNINGSTGKWNLDSGSLELIRNGFVEHVLLAYSAVDA